MKAVLVKGKGQLALETMPTPEPGIGEVRLRVRYAGICGSDLHYLQSGANGRYVIREPLIPGHELSCIVDHDPAGELPPGAGVTLHPARFGNTHPRYADSPHLWSGGSYLGSASTWPHTQGGMTEYVVVTRGMIRRLPCGLSLRRGVLSEPLAVSLHGLELAGGVEGCRVLISGGGPIGLLAAAASVARGAEEVVVSDVVPEPLARALAVGVSGVVDARIEEPQFDYFDVVLECSGALAAVNSGLSTVRPGGSFVQLGILPRGPAGVDLSSIISKEISIRGAFRFKDEIDSAVSLLPEIQVVDDLITHEFPLDRADEAFSVASDPRKSCKVVLSL